jgi:hypothetical protein
MKTSIGRRNLFQIITCASKATCWPIIFQIERRHVAEWPDSKSSKPELSFAPNTTGRLGGERFFATAENRPECHIR